MTIPEWCIFGTLALYLLTIAALKWIAFRQFDNSRPRDPDAPPAKGVKLGADEGQI
jgi:hypothetical protein